MSATLKFLATKGQSLTAKVYNEALDTHMGDAVVTEVIIGGTSTGIYQFTFPALVSGTYPVVVEDSINEGILFDIVHWDGSDALTQLHAIKVQTDLLPTAPAGVGDAMTIAGTKSTLDDLHDFDPDEDTVAHVTLVDVLADADLDTIKKLLEADIYIVSTTTPWNLVYMEKGTGAPGVGTELLRKALKEIDGTNITAATKIVGQHIHTS